MDEETPVRMAKKKYYVVWEGKEPGIYERWQDAQAQIKNWPGARYKAFSSRQEAEAAYHGHFSHHIDLKGKKKAQPAAAEQATRHEEVIWDSIAVDAACSGNPGEMEYQGVDPRTGTRLFYLKFPLGTNNIGEFLAIVHALAMLQKEGRHDTPVYTDSRIALGWVKKGKARTTLPRNSHTEMLYQLIERAEKWLATHSYRNPILKWDTERWGEIPADFGRK